jgi:hypothetical protein
MRHREAGEGMGKWGTIAIPGFKGGVPRRESMPEKRPPLMGDRGEEGKFSFIPNAFSKQLCIPPQNTSMFYKFLH